MGLKLYKRGDIYHIRGTHAGQLVRLSTGTDDPLKAASVLANIKREQETEWILSRDEKYTEWTEVANQVYMRSRASARERGVPFDLESHDVFWMMQKTGFRCAVSGIGFTKKISKQARPLDPWAPSLDRIVNRQGYVRDNVRVVCCAANIAMNEWGHDTLLRLARGVVRSADIIWPEDAEKLASN